MFDSFASNDPKQELALAMLFFELQILGQFPCPVYFSFSIFEGAFQKNQILKTQQPGMLEGLVYLREGLKMSSEKETREVQEKYLSHYRLPRTNNMFTPALFLLVGLLNMLAFYQHPPRGSFRRHLIYIYIYVGSTLTREPYRAFPTWPTKVPARTQKHWSFFLRPSFLWYKFSTNLRTRDVDRLLVNGHWHMLNHGRIIQSLHVVHQILQFG